MVDVLIILIALCGLGLLAHSYGADSRAAARSAKHELGRHGLVWQPAPVPVRPSARRRGPGV